MSDAGIIEWVAIGIAAAGCIFMAVLLVRAYAEDRRQELLAKEVKCERDKYTT